MISKNRLIYLLVSIVAGLLVLNVLLGLTEKKNNIERISELSKNNIEEDFIAVLNSVGIIEEWVSKSKIKKDSYDSIGYKYRVKVPAGITIPLILKDINEKFEPHPVEIASREIKINGVTSLEINSGSNTKLISEFKYYSNLIRPFSEVGFILTDFEDLSENDKKSLFKIAMPFGLVLPLDLESQGLAENIKKNGFEYFILLEDDSDYIDFELNDELDLNRLSKNIRSIISTFNSPRIFFIDQTKLNLSKSVVDFIYSEFEKKGRTVKMLSNYTDVKGENKGDLISLFQFHQNNLRSGEKKIYKLSVEDWLSLQTNVTDFLKLGNKIIEPSKLL